VCQKHDGQHTGGGRAPPTRCGGDRAAYEQTPKADDRQRVPGNDYARADTEAELISSVDKRGEE